jgi:hypothetical protein
MADGATMPAFNDERLIDAAYHAFRSAKHDVLEQHHQEARA